MIRFIWLKTDEYNHNDDRILKARVVIWLNLHGYKLTSSFSKKENKNQGAWEAQENFALVTNEEKAHVNHLTRKSPCIKCDGTRISGHKEEKQSKSPELFLHSSLRSDD